MKENLFMGHLGNGLTIADKNVIVNGDYKALAHISDIGNITWYAKKVSIEVRKEIEKQAEIIKSAI